jgi:hypothetical protein
VNVYRDIYFKRLQGNLAEGLCGCSSMLPPWNPVIAARK